MLRIRSRRAIRTNRSLAVPMVARNPIGQFDSMSANDLRDLVRYFPEADETIIGGIERGILFLMAFWSGPSVKTFASITKEVLRFDTSHALEFVVVDSDGSPALYEMPEFLGQIWNRAVRLVSDVLEARNLERPLKTLSAGTDRIRIGQVANPARLTSLLAASNPNVGGTYENFQWHIARKI